MFKNPEVEDKHLLEAISLKRTNCYAAMAFANALGGSKSPEWEICHNNTLRDLVEEAERRGLTLTYTSTYLDPIVPVTESLYYKRAMGLMSEKEFQTEFHKWQKGE